MSIVEQQSYSTSSTGTTSANTRQKINIPPRLPMILKQFCKAAIRTQPYDLLKWSSAYFRALAEGEEPPTKIRLEYPPPSTASGLTLGFLRVLLRQFGDYNKVLSIETILRRWDCLCLDRKDLNMIMLIGKFRRKCQVKKFLAIAVGLLTSSLSETMVLICELFTHEPDGGSAVIPVTLFMEIYGYLAGLRCDGSKRESSAEDVREFVIFDELDDSLAAKKDEIFNECQHNLILQDLRSLECGNVNIESDANIESESVSKDETDFSKHEYMAKSEITGANETFINSRDDTEEISKSSRQDFEEKEEGTVVSDSQTEMDQSYSQANEKSQSQGSNSLESNSLSPDNPQSNKNDSRHETQFKSKRIKFDEKLLRYYPNIPGIGPRLSAEEVATVAIWMTECAKNQEGMVGPRNLRHFQCPPLDKDKS